jgi:NAD(P)-dependent dehydrogenase (short-subunit alcohol dehydrogenase family)
MLLKDKTAVIYGAGGAVGGAVAQAFGREGAWVFLSGRDLGPVQAVAREIAMAGGWAEAAQVDALDEPAVQRHTDQVAEQAGGIDICFSAIGFPAVQGIPRPCADAGLVGCQATAAGWTATLQILQCRVRLVTSEESWELAGGDHLQIPRTRHRLESWRTRPFS